MQIDLQAKSVIQLNQMRLIEHLVRQVTSGSISQLQLAAATGVHQSQVSRILSGKALRASKNVLKLCKYAESLPSIVEERVDLHDDVMAAVSKLLGKNKAEDQALAQLVSSLGNWRKLWRADRE